MPSRATIRSRGHEGLAAPVFDIDSVGLLSLLSAMNNGLADERRADERLDPTDFFLGCTVTNHKRHEREVMPQLFKLRKKIDAGARFVISQIGWNTRKDDELVRWIRHDRQVSVLANVFLLSGPAARVFHAGRIPGVYVNDELLALAERYAAGADKGRAFFVDLAAKHIAVVRGLGYDGVYLGGQMPAAVFGEILDRADSFAAGWRDVARGIQFGFADEFHLYEEDPQTGLASGETSASYLESKRRRRTALRVPVSYRLDRRLHAAVFAPEAPLHPAGRAFYRAVDRGAASGRKGFAHAGAGGEGARLPLPRLWRLLATGDCLRLPGVDVREESTQRTLRRHA